MVSVLQIILRESSCMSHGLTDLENLARLTLFTALHVFGLEVDIFDDNGAVVGKDLSDFSNFALVSSRYNFDSITKLDMHFVQNWKTVWFAFLPFPTLKLKKGKKKNTT